MTKMIKLTSLLLLVALCVGVLASCGVNSYEKRLDKAGYTVEVVNKDDLKAMNEKLDALEEDDDIEYKLKAFLSAIDLEDGKYVEVAKFGSKKQAKAFAEKRIEGLGMYEKVEVKGKFVVYGTEDGVKDAMK